MQRSVQTFLQSLAAISKLHPLTLVDSATASNMVYQTLRCCTPNIFNVRHNVSGLETAGQGVPGISSKYQDWCCVLPPYFVLTCIASRYTATFGQSCVARGHLRAFSKEPNHKYEALRNDWSIIITPTRHPTSTRDPQMTVSMCSFSTSIPIFPL